MPILMSALPFKNVCWYHISHKRVAREASMPLIVFKLSRFSALRLRPWIWSALTLNRPPSQPNAFLRVQLQSDFG